MYSGRPLGCQHCPSQDELLGLLLFAELFPWDQGELGYQSLAIKLTSYLGCTQLLWSNGLVEEDDCAVSFQRRKVFCHEKLEWL